MSIAQSCPAKNLENSIRQQVVMEIITGKTTVSQAANDYDTSRKFMAAQKDKALAAINNVFNINKVEDDKILFHLPITNEKIEEIVLSEMLDCRSGYRGIIKSLKSFMSYGISLGRISEIFKKYAVKSAAINKASDLAMIEEGALDELHHLGKPTLVGVDVTSLYCFLLSEEDYRDADTWAIKLLELEDQCFAPLRTFADFAGGIRAGQTIAFDDLPCFGDQYHALHKINEAKRLMTKIYQGKITAATDLEGKAAKSSTDGFSDAIIAAYEEEELYKSLSIIVSILAGWLHNDIFKIEGYNPETRSMLYDFIIDELTKLEKLHPKHIKALRVFLVNKKPLLLSFVTNMDKQFAKVALENKVSKQTIWDICQLMRYGYNNPKYHDLEVKIRLQLKNNYFKIYSAVREIINNTVRSSSAVENLNSRIRPYYELRKRMGQDFLELLRFYLNHSVLQGSDHVLRKGKTPVEIMTGKKHLYWLEMLGIKRVGIRTAA
jgi:hypothetical protein